MSAADRTQLLPHEIQVIQELSAGKSAKQIADIIKVNKWTVDRYVSAAMGVAGVRSSAGLVGYAFRAGLIR
jgi:DNA-binding NarL/FixJ family response regulator